MLVRRKNVGATQSEKVCHVVCGCVLCCVHWKSFSMTPVIRPYSIILSHSQWPELKRDSKRYSAMGICHFPSDDSWPGRVTRIPRRLKRFCNAHVAMVRCSWKTQMIHMYITCTYIYIYICMTFPTYANLGTPSKQSRTCADQAI